MARAEAYVRAHASTPVAVNRLCRIVGLSERGLRNAFYAVRGTGPKRWMLLERLVGARRALTESSARPDTVASVATRYGFYELGRFAGTYREAFGETPLKTLKRAVPPSATTHLPVTKGSANAAIR